jgi:hypothetical protein
VIFTGPRDATIFRRPIAMRPAISNLVDNAIKCGGTVAVALVPAAGRVVITIEDEGPGFRGVRSEQEKVFELFYGIGSARDTGGAGLPFRYTLDHLGTRRKDHPRQSQGRRLSVRLELLIHHGFGSMDYKEITLARQLESTARMAAPRPSGFAPIRSDSGEYAVQNPPRYPVARFDVLTRRLHLAPTRAM